jgi:hypothetical protein
MYACPRAPLEAEVARHAATTTRELQALWDDDAAEP